MKKPYTSRLYNIFIEYTDHHNFTVFICTYMKKMSDTYDPGSIQKFFKDFIKYRGVDWNITSEFEKYRQLGHGVTKEKSLIRYGETEGISRWNAYVNAQAETNTLDYKKKKYNWTDEQFAEYNKSRAVTEFNLIKKHGKDKGLVIWNRYVERQRHAGCSLSYFVEKLGVDEGTEFYKNLNKKKILSLDNFILKYGEESGTEHFERWVKKLGQETSRHSKVSQDFFDEIISGIPAQQHEDIFYGRKNYEYVFCSKHTNRVSFADFYDISSNKIIEFYGDYYHCNPNKYAPDFFNNNTQLTAQEKWISDEHRIKILENEFGAEVLIIWEFDVRNSRKEVVNKCLKFLNYES